LIYLTAKEVEKWEKWPIFFSFWVQGIVCSGRLAAICRRLIQRLSAVVFLVLVVVYAGAWRVGRRKGKVEGRRARFRDHHLGKRERQRQIVCVCERERERHGADSERSSSGLVEVIAARNGIAS
jgi:hypothetical protein